MATPVSLYGFLTPKPGHADELRKLLMDLVEPSRGHEGSLRYHLHEQEDGRFFLYEVWRSQEDLQSSGQPAPADDAAGQAEKGFHGCRRGSPSGYAVDGTSAAAPSFARPPTDAHPAPNHAQYHGGR
jgi:quinol monooxygenase YgiN